MSDKIFISSTCFDLLDLRAEIKEFIYSIGLTPILSDHSDTDFITFQDKNSIQTCLINLANSKVVVVILSQRYGPSLQPAGFTDHSATHLEYLEAVKSKIKTIVFVRDRLEADFLAYKKSGNAKVLQWIKEKDIKLFDIIEQHKKLANDDRNNWYWTFKNSIDLKQRLKIDLKTEIDANRLNQLIESGNCPLLTLIATGHTIPNSKNIFVKLTIENLGNQSAVEPFAVIFKADSYKQVIDGNLDKSILNYELINFQSLHPKGKNDTVTFQIEATDQERAKHKVKAVIEIVYRTIYGDLISDITELDIYINITNELKFFSKYTTKRYRGGTAYEKLT
jgi:hypothetical protein